MSVWDNIQDFSQIYHRQLENEAYIKKNVNQT